MVDMFAYVYEYDHAHESYCRHVCMHVRTHVCMSVYLQSLRRECVCQQMHKNADVCLSQAPAFIN